jgi:hypothetical protein
MNWADLTRDSDQWQALVNTVMNLRVPKILGKSYCGWETCGLSRRALLHGVSLVVLIHKFYFISFTYFDRSHIPLYYLYKIKMKC